MSNFEDEALRKFAKEFSTSYGIKTDFLLLKDLLKNAKFSLSCDNDKFSSTILGIDFEKVKIFFANSILALSPEDIKYSSKKDADYAIQEWGAALLALFSSQEKTKFINPYLSKYRNESEIEQLLLLQRAGLDTAEILLSNNSVDAIDFLNIHNRRLLIKEATAGYAKSRFFDDKQLLNMSKLKLTPCIFQKCLNGSNIEILLIGDSYLARNLSTEQYIKIPKGLQDKLVQFCNDANIKMAVFSAMFDGEKYCFYSINQYIVFSVMFDSYGEYFKTAFTNFLIKEYNN